MTLLVYGSYGYTGQLVVDRAVEEGLEPVLAGRDTERVEAQAAEHGLEARPFGLDHDDIVRDRVADANVVLNCAGPFARTYEPLVSACLGTGTDYLDITGEIEVFEAIADRDADAEDADVTLLPGVGFDVVPTDCLAAHLHAALPEATHLELALRPSGGISHGTALTAIQGMGDGRAVREHGRIVRADHPRRRTVDFGGGTTPTEAITIPWGDVSTAYYSTGVENVAVYLALPERALDVFEYAQRYGNVLGSAPVERALSWLVDRTVDGPSAEERASGEARIWGEARTDDGDRVVARLRTPETYRLTALTAVEAARRALDDDAPTGFQTPSSAFGPDFVTEFDGVEREDAHEPETAAARRVGD